MRAACAPFAFGQPNTPSNSFCTRRYTCLCGTHPSGHGWYFSSGDWSASRTAAFPCLIDLPAVERLALIYLAAVYERRAAERV